MDDLERRLLRLEATAAITNLAVRYGLAVDDRDYDTIRTLFADDAVLRTAQGVVKGDGIDGVLGYFTQHLPELGVSNHFVNGHLIDLDDIDDDMASGVVFSHAEVVRGGRPMVTAMRYLDRYVRGADSTWRFQERVQTYMYFTDVRTYPDVLLSDLRIRTSATPQPADWPITA
jgi:hypothetical protein